MLVIYTISIRKLLKPWRLGALLFIALIPLLPLLIFQFITTIETSLTPILNLVFMLVVPLVALITGPSVFGDEIEEKTLSYITLTPIKRTYIVLAKMLAAFTVAAFFVVFSVVICISIATATTVNIEDGATRPLLASVTGSLVGVAAYSAILTWIGLVVSRPLAIGFMYVIIWEAALVNIFEAIFSGSGFRYISVSHYMRGIVSAIDSTIVDANTINLASSLIGAGVVITIFFLLGVRRLKRMDLV